MKPPNCLFQFPLCCRLIQYDVICFKINTDGCGRFFFLWSNNHNDLWAYSCVFKRIKTNKHSNYSTVDRRNARTHKHTRLINAAISFLLLFQAFTFNTAKLMRMPGRLRWSGNGCVPCHASFCYIIHFHSVCGGALRGWNINTNEVAGLTTQTRHLHWAWTRICTTVNTCLTGGPGLLGSSRLVVSKSRRCWWCCRVHTRIKQRKAIQKRGGRLSRESN